MATLTIALLAWIFGAFVLGCFVGKFIRFAGSPPEPKTKNCTTVQCRVMGVCYRPEACRSEPEYWFDGKERPDGCVHPECNCHCDGGDCKHLGLEDNIPDEFYEWDYHESE